MTTPQLAALAATLVVTYLVCGIPFGLVVALRMGHVDVRRVGSGNIGTTNVAREVGKGAAALTLLLDAGKGWVCVRAGVWALNSFAFAGSVSPAGDPATSWVGALVIAAAVSGHVFSPYLGFHGGKGIAVGFGSVLGYLWPVALGLLAVFLVLALATRRVSVGSIAAGASLPVITAAWCAFARGAVSWPLVAVTLAVGCLVVWAHRSNIDKLAHGREGAFSFHRADGDGGRR